MSLATLMKNLGTELGRANMFRVVRNFSLSIRYQSRCWSYWSEVGVTLNGLGETVDSQKMQIGAWESGNVEQRGS